MPARLLPFELGFCAVYGFFGAHVAAAIASVAAIASELPPWSALLLGPLGSLIGTLVAVWWLARRLNRVEDASTQQRQRDHEALMGILTSQIEVATKCHLAIESSTRVLERISAEHR